jgi:hypothetical protein
MAKTLKAKTSRRKSRAKRATAGHARSGALVMPTYLPDGQSYTMGLADVVRALKVIEKHKRLSKFVKDAKEQGTSVTVDARTVNFVKDFFVETKMHTDPIGRHIVNARRETGLAPMARGVARRGRFNCRF